MANPILEKEFEYYKRNQNALLQEYGGKYIVITGEKVIGAYDSEMEAYTRAQESHQLGTFLIQHCVPGTEGYTQTFHSRVTLV